MFFEIRDKAPFGITAVVGGQRVPLIGGEQYIYEWPEPLSLVDFERLTRQIRRAVARVYFFPAEYIPAILVVQRYCPGLTGQEMRRIAKFVAVLGTQGAKALEESYKYLISNGVDPSRIPYRYAVPAAVRVAGNKAGEAVYALMNENPNRAAWGNAAAAKIISDAIQRQQGESPSLMIEQTKRRASPKSRSVINETKGQSLSPTYITINIQTGQISSDAPLPDSIVDALESICSSFKQEENNE